ncbi:MAG TPA: biotin/lipoyl-binding protein, partial [Vicinamibacterales bacterium]
MKKRRLTKLILLGAVTLGAGVWICHRRAGTDAPAVRTAAVTVGDIRETVRASGVLEGVTTVAVGTQVSGVVSWLGADFNSVVRKGQVIARLDPSLLQTQVEQARANKTRV